ncbi:MAG: ASPIC/UnbV domain-containing protein, partial [Planctomycetaceae bacterium]|nr:ASPIC/UnbV domain-containing protein [Planctomycetaceae bacterium]
RLGRAVAQADFDQDGLADLVVVNQHDRAALLKNQAKHGHGISLRLHGITCNRDCWGAEVEVVAGDQILVDQLVAGESFGCTHDPTLYFGLGEWAGDCQVTIRWPQKDHQTDQITVPADHRVVVFQDETPVVYSKAFP